MTNAEKMAHRLVRLQFEVPSSLARDRQGLRVITYKRTERRSERKENENV